MTFWKWVFKIAIQVIPILLGIDWSRPRPNEIPDYSIKPRRKKRRWRNFFE